MNLASLQPILDWIAAHPTWAGLFIFAVAFSESLAFIGLFVPGAVMLFGFGALVAAGALELSSALAWAAAGAVAGDGLSYWLGIYFKQDLQRIWPFSRHPELLERGQSFFQRHGGKSVLFGRFFGPIRAVIPVVAGMLGMTKGRFFTVNVFSALLWAPAYILPGVVFGASLRLAAEVASRLVVLVVVLLALLGLGVWLTKRLFAFLQPRAQALGNDLLAWSLHHPLLGRPARALLDPAQPEARVLLVMGGVLWFAAWGFFEVLGGVLGDHPPAFDYAVYQWLQGLRTPRADNLMVAVTQLGDNWVIAAVVLAVSGFLITRRRWLAAGHWLAAALFANLLSRVFKASVASPRPQALYEGVSAYAFPSGHTTMGTVMFGFLAVLVARGLDPDRRWAPYVAAAALVLPIAFSRLYLGAHWLSDVLGGLTLGVAWVALLGIAYVRHRPGPEPARGLAVTALVAMLVAGSWHIVLHHGSELARYTPERVLIRMDADVWWEQGWRELATYRADLRGRPSQPFNLQWAGSLEELRTHLTARGWLEPLPLTVANSLRWLSRQAKPRELPVPAHIHDGQWDSLRLVHPTADPQRLLVLRLWPAQRVLSPGDITLWEGYVGYLRTVTSLPLITWLRTGDDFDTPLRALAPALEGLKHHRVQRSKVKGFGGRWDGAVWLLRGQPS